MKKAKPRIVTRFDIKKEKTISNFAPLKLRVSGAVVKLSSFGGHFLIYNRSDEKSKSVFQEKKLAKKVLIFRANGNIFRTLEYPNKNINFVDFLGNRQVFVLFDSGEFEILNIFSGFKSKNGVFKLSKMNSSRSPSNLGLNHQSNAKEKKLSEMQNTRRKIEWKGPNKITQVCICMNSLAFVTEIGDLYLTNRIGEELVERVLQNLFNSSEFETQFENIESQIRFSKFAESEFVLLGKSKIKPKFQKQVPQRRLSQLLYDEKDCLSWEFICDPKDPTGTSKFVLFPHISQGILCMHWNGARGIVKHHLKRTKGKIMLIRADRSCSMVAVLSIYMTVEFLKIKDLKKGVYISIECIELTQQWISENRFKNIFWLNKQIVCFVNVENVNFLAIDHDKLPSKLPGNVERGSHMDRVFCFLESDGLRVLSINYQKETGSNVIYRILSQAELNIESVSSTHVAAQLFKWFKSENRLNQKNIIKEESLWKNQGDLLSGIESFLEAIRNKSNQGQMTELLRALRYAKLFLSEEETEKVISRQIRELLTRIKLWVTLRHVEQSAMTLTQFDELINQTEERGTRLAQFCSDGLQFELAKNVVNYVCTDKRDIVILFRAWTSLLIQSHSESKVHNKNSYNNQLLLFNRIFTLFSEIHKENKCLPKTEFILVADHCTELGLNVLAEELMSINNPPRIKIRRYLRMKRPLLGLRETIDFPDSNYIYMLLGEIYSTNRDRGIKLVERKVATLESELIWKHWDNLRRNVLCKDVDFENRIMLSEEKSDVTEIICDNISRILKEESPSQVVTLRKCVNQMDMLLKLRRDRFVVMHFRDRVLPFFQFLALHSLKVLRFFLKSEKFRLNEVSVNKVLSAIALNGDPEFGNLENNSNITIANVRKIKLEKFKSLAKFGEIESVYQFLVDQKLIQVVRSAPLTRRWRTWT